MSMQEWTARVITKHEAEVVKGLHDDACEWRANGHFLCNCSPRRRIRDGYTEPPEALVFSNPSCPRCYTEVEHDGDCFRCDTCLVTWPDPDKPAEFYDDHGALNIAEWDAKRAEAAGTAQT